jgi:hypothetical protein
MARFIQLSGIKFKRDENDDWEDGLIVNADGLIIDMDGKPVPTPVWDFRYRTHLFCVHFVPDARELEEPSS